jgi:germination protein M
MSEIQHLDEFIEDLIHEKKPRVYEQDSTDPEMEKMFETIRAVKRLRKSNPAAKGFLKSRWFKGLATVAAVLLLAAGLMNIPGPQEGNIVHAVVKAYEELQSYSGVAEIRSERDGEIEFQETIDIQYKKPCQYSAHHRYNDYEKSYISDGERLVVIEPEMVTVENVFPEKELWRYHIGTAVWELENAAEVHQIGTKTLFGRKAAVLEYRYSGDSVSHQMWIDQATNLPLRKILNHPEGSKLVVEFKELQINPVLPDNIFSWTPPQGVKLHQLNRSGNLEEIKKAWPEVTKLCASIPQEMKLEKIGVLEKDLYAYVLRFQGPQENDFMDIYYGTMPGEFSFLPEIERGKLADGYIDLEPKARSVFKRYIGESNVARWVRDDAEVFIASSRDIPQLLSILENLAGEKAKFGAVKQEEVMELYFMQVTETAFKLGKEKRAFDTTPGPRELMEELLKGPQDESLNKVIPAGTKLLTLRVEGVTAYVDFSGEIATANYGGEIEGVLIDSIVWTLTQLEEIEFVQILVDGKVVESLGGHYLIDKPLSR